MEDCNQCFFLIIKANDSKIFDKYEYNIKKINIFFKNNSTKDTNVSFEYFFNKQKINSNNFTIAKKSEIKIQEILVDNFNFPNEFFFEINNFNNNNPIVIQQSITKKWITKELKNILLRKNPQIQLQATNLQSNNISLENIQVGKYLIKPNFPLSKLKKNEYEMDLHIKDFDKFEFQEILFKQIKLIESFIDKALINGLSEIVFIHGIGAGTLKKELHLILKNHKFVRHYENKYSPKYGYGATFVYF